MKKISCFDNEFMLDDYCDECRYFDITMGQFGGCLKSVNLFVGFTNAFECEDFLNDIAKRL